MGRDVIGWIERRPEGEDSWRVFLDLTHFVNVPDEVTEGLLGIPPSSLFHAPFDGRGLPNDLSSEVAAAHTKYAYAETFAPWVELADLIRNRVLPEWRPLVQIMDVVLSEGDYGEFRLVVWAID